MAPRDRTTRSEHDRRSERGIAIVEFSFVAIFIFALVGATVDFGLGWRAGTALIESARAGTRVGAAMAQNPRTDYEVLSSVRASLQSAGHLDEVERVIIYRSNSSDGLPPATCTASTPTGSTCIVVNRQQLIAAAPSNFSYTLSTPPTGSGCMTSNRLLATSTWCPRDRNNTMGSAHYIGVEVKIRKPNLFPILGEDQVITRRSVMRLEPSPL